MASKPDVALPLEVSDSSNEKLERNDGGVDDGFSDDEATHKAHEVLRDENDPDLGKSPEERAAIDRKLRWKIDLAIIPWLSFLYLLSFLDRSNIGNARLAGLEDDLNMAGHDYNNALTIFFVSYSLAEPVTNVILKRVTPRIFLTAIIVLWGICMTLMGVVSSYGGLLGARFALGLAEAGLYPGANYYISCWYKRGELGIRTALFFSMAAMAGSFGGLLAAAISQMDGLAGVAGWAWIFIIEGLVTVVAGIASWWLVFDWPETARFLSPEDRLRCQRRLAQDGQTHTSENYDKRHIYAAFKDWKLYAFSYMWMGNITPLYAFSLFLPTILAGMGYEGTHAQLLTVPPYAVAVVLTISVGFAADRVKRRGIFNICFVLLGITGFIMLLSTGSPRVQYAGTFMAAGGIYPTIPNSISWAANNFEGLYKRGVVVGTMVGWGNLMGVISSNIYLGREEPRYWTGHGLLLAWEVVFLLCGSIGLYILLGWENKARKSGKRDHWVEGKTREEVRFMGDKRPDFIYMR